MNSPIEMPARGQTVFRFMTALLVWGILFGLGLTGTRAAERVSIAGQWRFALDRVDDGISEEWFNKTLPDQIDLPGALQSQGFGDEISIHTPW
ncbi:MAG: hypothetical protein H7Y43_00620, partial [Akkermansiaceae bacterium]|nr:hypothetical protein [Verrucomicrobiales bacterium]